MRRPPVVVKSSSSSSRCIVTKIQWKTIDSPGRSHEIPVVVVVVVAVLASVAVAGTREQGQFKCYSD